MYVLENLAERETLKPLGEEDEGAADGAGSGGQKPQEQRPGRAVVVGAGLAGLAAATVLKASGGAVRWGLARWQAPGAGGRETRGWEHTPGRIWSQGGRGGQGSRLLGFPAVGSHAPGKW